MKIDCVIPILITKEHIKVQSRLASVRNYTRTTSFSNTYTTASYFTADRKTNKTTR